MGKKYSLGLDYGTQSGRAVLVDVTNGEVIAQATKMYTHGVMEEYLPDGTRLGPDWALEDPADYLEVLEETIPAVLKESGVPAEAVSYTHLSTVLQYGGYLDRRPLFGCECPGGCGSHRIC